MFTYLSFATYNSDFCVVFVAATPATSDSVVVAAATDITVSAACC